MINDEIKKGLDGTSARNLLRIGMIKNGEPMQKLFIAVCNFYVAIILKKLADGARQAIHKTGSDPFKFNTIAIVDGIVMRNRWIRFFLPIRKLEDVALITNGRFSEVFRGIPSGHIYPEAGSGGMIDFVGG
nr:dihydroxy-acid dehydratase [Sporolactobacillus pectinivorans]